MMNPTTSELKAKPENQKSLYNVHYLDLETAALPLEILRPRMPEFQAPVGWKDPEKIQKAIDEKREKWLDDAALSPLTGQILAAIWVEPDGNSMIYDADELGEGQVISMIFNRLMESGRGAYFKVAGFNLADFDFPFLFKRAWATGRRIPSGLLDGRGKWFDLPSWIIDLRHLWGMGDRQAPGSLGVIAEYLGVGEKQGHGTEFARLWRDPTRHAEGKAYLLNDGAITRNVATRLFDLCPDQYGLNIGRVTTKPNAKHESRLSREDSSENHPQEDR